ncbi:MAG: Glu/Leu/Phe/Val dehydrogenase [Candidatus Brocadiaceae bacterium]|nr:Glu/Leu/Phe/Val dehydrogenase [Candidatus Brocadiaceae bacterium]
MSSVVDFDALRTFMDVPEAARCLLSKPEKEICFNLNLKSSSGALIEGDCFVVYHCTVRGPAKGGIRMSAHGTLEEVRRLAELMSLKTALAGIPFGGGKSCIAIDPASLNRFEKTAMLKEFVHMLRLELEHGAYIPAPDMGTGPTDMAVIFGETHMLESVTGKPPRVGGLPGRLEATGRGVSHAALLALDKILKKPVRGATAALQGFGNVGSHTAAFLADAGVKLKAVGDITGAVHNEGGLDVAALREHVARTGGVAGFSESEPISDAELLAMDVDLLLPCALEDVLHKGNAGDVRAAAVVEGANGPTTPEAAAILAARSVPVVPDILANGGGVIASYVEWRKAKSGALTTREETFALVDERTEWAFAQMLDMAAAKGCSLREACFAIAVKELTDSMIDRGWV